MWDNYDNSPSGRNLLFGVAIGAAVVGLVWAMFAWTGNDSSASPDAGGAGPAGQSGGPSPSAQNVAHTGPTQEKLRRCHEVYTAQTGVLHDAGVAVAQWQIHIGAMNQLVVGALTLKQASQFWAQTRVGARTHTRTFDAALQQLNTQAARCKVASKVAAKPTESPVQQKLQSCQLAVATRNEVLQAARKALDTWSHHIQNMEMLRNGTMSPTTAEALWIKSWHAGQQEVNRYRSARNKSHAYAAHC